MKPATQISNRRSAIRSAMFFLAFTIAMLLFGGWMLYRFSVGPNSSHHLSFMAIAMGVMLIAAACLPCWFAVAIIRRLHIFDEPQRDG